MIGGFDVLDRRLPVAVARFEDRRPVTSWPRSLPRDRPLAAWYGNRLIGQIRLHSTNILPTQMLTPRKATPQVSWPQPLAVYVHKCSHPPVGLANLRFPAQCAVCPFDK